MTDRIVNEREYRLKLWQDLVVTDGTQSVNPRRLRELGIYGGAQGIWVDKIRTRLLTADSSGVSVGLLHTGATYADDLSDDGVIYHFPTTKRSAGRDAAEVNSTKAAKDLGLPVFVISPGSSSANRRVRLAWVEDWDDRAKLFLISFGDRRPELPAIETDDDELFQLIDKTPRQRTETDARQGQQLFKFQVIKRYGPSCAVCGIDILAVLDAAHLCPKGQYGCDDPRNGLVLCAVHHRALDAGIFGLCPRTGQIHFRTSGPFKEDLRITYPSLAHLPKQPHREALGWLWQKWGSRENTET